MVLVGAGRGLIGNRSLSQAILGGEGGAFDAEFIDELEGRIEVSGESAGLGLRNGNSVVEDLGLEVDAAVDLMRKSCFQ